MLIVIYGLGGGPKKDFKNLTAAEQAMAVDFADLLNMTAKAVPGMRIRYSTSHPKDISRKVIETMAAHRNICNYVHLPAQSGSNRILELMNRNYTREWYFDKINMIHEILPDAGISCDLIAGFCTETEQDHKDTLDLLQRCRFDFNYMYKYSERPGTPAEKKMVDDVDEATKGRRLQEIIDLQSQIGAEKNKSFIGKVVEVLIEGESKRSADDWKGRNDQNLMCVFPKGDFGFKKGDLVKVLIERTSSTTLLGHPIEIAEMLAV